jgi:hypothetical protein
MTLLRKKEDSLEFFFPDCSSSFVDETNCPWGRKVVLCLQLAL